MAEPLNLLKLIIAMAAATHGGHVTTPSIHMRMSAPPKQHVTDLIWTLETESPMLAHPPRLINTSLTVNDTFFNNYSVSSTTTPLPISCQAFKLQKNPHILLFDPEENNIQSCTDALYEQQATSQFDNDPTLDKRYALLFKPGTYQVNVKVGYYTEVIGLGASPDDVTL